MALLFPALLAVALAEDACLPGDGICLADDSIDGLDEEAVMLLQTRAFLERPPLTVAEGMQVELHAVELKADVQTVPGIPADTASAELAQDEPVSPVTTEEPPRRPAERSTERPHASLLAVSGTVEQKAPSPSVVEPSPIVVAAQPATSAVSRGDVDLSNSTGLDMAEQQKKVNLEKLATLVAEAAVLLIVRSAGASGLPALWRRPP